MVEADSVRIKDVFNAARALPPDERPACLDSTCGDDAALRQQVEALLAAWDELGTFLESPTMPENGGEPSTPDVTENGESAAEAPGAVIGRYKILQVIGEGGFGRVYMAEQTEPVVRRVALKVIKLGMDTRQVIARFEAERQALAMMDHPNIARVLDAGATDSGRPYFVMELVRGDPITEYCDRNHLSIGERLDLFTQVCRAVQHAHQKGIIHRDLKPSNVLITIADGRPLPKVIDFGIAKATSGGARLTARTLFTEHRALIGTPEYMSPEQAEMSGVDIDTRSDIYSLGVLLYELLTGVQPFDPERLRSAAFAEIQRIIREEEPVKPSTRLSSLAALPSVAAQRHIEPARLSKLMRGDLDWIVMKCLEKDRTRRYETAEGLAQDIARHAAHEPVLAGPPGASYRLAKFVRRNRRLVASAAIFVLLLTGGIVATSWQAIRATHAEEAASTEASTANAVIDLLNQMLSSADPHEVKGANYTVRQLLDEFAAGLNEQLKGQPDVEAAIRATIGTAYLGLGLPDAAEPQLLRALELRQRDRDDLDPNVLSARFALISVLHDRGQYSKAEGEVRRILDRIGDREDLAAARQSYNDKLADILNHLARYDEAERLHLEILAARRRALGDEHPDTLVSMNNLGNVLQKQGRYAEAEALHARVLEIRKRVLGEEHPDTLDSMNNLANVYYSQGRYAEAEALHRQTLDIRRRVFGEEHPHTLKSMNNLAAVYDKQSRYADAEAMHRQTLESRRRVLGEEHPDTLASMNNLAIVYEAQGRPEDALALRRQLLEHVTQMAHETNATAEQLNNVAWDLLTSNYEELRDPALALEFATRAAALTEHLNPDILDTLALAMDMTGHSASAIVAAYSKALSVHPPDAAIRNDLAWQLVRFPDSTSFDPERAVELALAAAESLPTAAYVRNTLGMTLYWAGRFEESIAAFEESIELAPPQGFTTDWYFMAMAWERLGSHERALECFQTAGSVTNETISATDVERFERIAREVLGIDNR